MMFVYNRFTMIKGTFNNNADNRNLLIGMQVSHVERWLHRFDDRNYHLVHNGDIYIMRTQNDTRALLNRLFDENKNFEASIFFNDVEMDTIKVTPSTIVVE